MSKSHKYIIALDITTTSPMHITAIEGGSYDVKSQRVSRYKTASGIGCSLTRTMGLAHCATERKTDEDGESKGIYTPLVPVIPSSTISGKLRRAASDLLCNSLISRSLKISTSAYNVLSTGMATTALDTNKKNAQVLVMARKDAFLSLFGGTSFGLSAHSVIDTGLPLVAMTEGQLMTPPIIDKQPLTSLREMTETIAIIKKDDVMDMHRSSLEGVVGYERVSDYIAAKTTEATDKKKTKEEDAGKKTDLRTFNAFEAVKAGVSFGLRIEVTSFEPSHLGLMLLSVQEMLRAGQFGGKGAKGFGRFALGASRLYEVDPTTRKQSLLCELFRGKDTGYEFVIGENEDDVVGQAVLAAEDYIDNVSPVLIEAFAEADVKALRLAYKDAVADVAEEA